MLIQAIGYVESGNYFLNAYNRNKNPQLLERAIACYQASIQRFSDMKSRSLDFSSALFNLAWTYLLLVKHHGRKDLMSQAISTAMQSVELKNELRFDEATYNSRTIRRSLSESLWMLSDAFLVSGEFVQAEFYLNAGEVVWDGVQTEEFPKAFPLLQKIKKGEELTPEESDLVQDLAAYFLDERIGEAEKFLQNHNIGN